MSRVGKYPVEIPAGVQVAIACFLGRLFMKPVDSPWQAADRVLADMPTEARVRLIDFHAEAHQQVRWHRF